MCSSAKLRRSFTQREADTNPLFSERESPHHNDFPLLDALFGLAVEIDHMQCLTHYPGCCAHTPELKCNCRSPQQQRLVHNHNLQIVAATSHAGYLRGSTNLHTLCSCTRCIIMHTDADICVCVCACLRMCVCVSQDSRSLLILAISKLELITHRDTHWTGPETCRYDNGFGSHLEDGPCDLHDSSGRHSKSQQKCDSARTDED